MSATAEQSRKVVPAQLGFFAIYNPSLGTTDETLKNQIVYYSSPEARERSRQRNSSDTKAIDDALREENNEQLRQIGLAQGMVEFGRSFSDGKSVDTIETEKSRIILHELEAGWWVLASIDLTILPSTTKTPSPKGKTVGEEKIEYSSREVKPAILLLGDVLRAHSTFLLHHASSMSALFVRTRRSKFIGILGRYWDTFLSTWSVLMHGNPASNLYGGIKIAACGELGIGVGEEERGSGERDVLEGFVGRIDGLVDVLVSKFGDAVSNDGTSENKKGTARAKPTAPWLGSGNEPAAEDGAVFLGTGALSRKSIRDVSHWVEDLYRWGPYAYGVMDNPTSNRRTKKSKQKQLAKKKGLSPDAKKKSRQVYGLSLHDRLPHGQSSLREDTMATVPPMPVEDGDGANHRPESKQRRPSLQRGPSSIASTDSETQKGSRLVQYLKLGYGTHWSLGGSAPPTEHDGKAGIQPASSDDRVPGQVSTDHSEAGNAGFYDVPTHPKKDWKGHYLIGLMGNIEDEEERPAETDPGSNMGHDGDDDGDNDRVLLRTVTVELEREEDARAEADISIDLGNTNSDSKSSKHTGSERTGTSNTSFESQDRNKTKKLRVVAYVNKPFIFVFLFELRTEVLAMASLYRSLHYQIGPLIKPLLTSTTFRASKPEIPATEDTNTPIYDLIWDPKLLTVTSSIPNIPDPYQVHSTSHESLPWSRIEALNTHMQIIHTYIATTTDRSELERTCKTSRGWWVVWTRIPDPESNTASPASGQVKVPGLTAKDSPESQTPLGLDLPSHGTSTFGTSMASGPAHPFLETVNSELFPKDKEIFLIRRASDYVAAKSSGRLASGSSTAGSESWTAGPGKLAQGIGVDTKRYIEALLNLN